MVNNLKNLKVLITGHTGFKGAWMSFMLHKLGCKLYGISKDIQEKSLFIDTSAHHLFQDSLTDCDIITNRASEFINRIQPNVIIHLAAQPLVIDAVKDPLGTYSDNIMGTAHILEYSKSLNSLNALLIITTDKCYVNNESVYGLRENEPLGGDEPYSASKACAEILCNAFIKTFKDRKFAFATARAGNVVGYGDYGKYRLLPDLIDSIVSSKQIDIRNPLATRPWQHVLDCNFGYITLLNKMMEDSSFCDNFNFGPYEIERVSVKDIISIATFLYPNISKNINMSFSSIKEKQSLRLDVTKSYIDLGYKNLYTQKQAINITLNSINKINDMSPLELVLSEVNEYFSERGAA